MNGDFRPTPPRYRTLELTLSSSLLLGQHRVTEAPLSHQAVLKYADPMRSLSKMRQLVFLHGGATLKHLIGGCPGDKPSKHSRPAAHAPAFTAPSCVCTLSPAGAPGRRNQATWRSGNTSIREARSPRLRDARRGRGTLASRSACQIRLRVLLQRC